MDLSLVLHFLGSARNASCEGPKDVGGIRRGGRKGGRCLDAWHDVGTVEADTPIVEFAVVWGNEESRLGDFSLVDSQTPEGEKFDLGVDVLFVEILVLIVGVDKLLSSRPACKDKGKGGEGVCCEDCIAKERSGEEAPESFEDNACGVVQNGEGGQFNYCEASIDVLNGRDDFLDGEERCSVVDNDGDGYRACPD
jgi:hypothetical protein